jgi:ribosome-associated heat shock protein Hsp15
MIGKEFLLLPMGDRPRAETGECRSAGTLSDNASATECEETMRGHKSDGDRDDAGAGSNDVRLDKWLWAARFYKTRSIAAEAIVGGKVQLNGERAKRAKNVAIGDELRIRNGAFEHIVIVRALSGRRGSAPDAAKLYEETVASRTAREALSVQMKSLPGGNDTGRPSKKARRDLARFRERS